MTEDKRAVFFPYQGYTSGLRFRTNWNGNPFYLRKFRPNYLVLLVNRSFSCLFLVSLRHFLRSCGPSLHKSSTNTDFRLFLVNKDRIRNEFHAKKGSRVGFFCTKFIFVAFRRGNSAFTVHGWKSHKQRPKIMKRWALGHFTQD